MKRALALLLVLLLAACQQPPLTPLDLQARKFEAVPGMSVIYLVRDYPDFTDVQATVYLDDEVTLKTYPGTYYRWEVPPGEHRIRGAAFDTGAVRLTTEPGRLYFVQQRVNRFFMGNPSSFFQVVPDPPGRAAVLRSVLLAPDRSTF